MNFKSLTASIKSNQNSTAERDATVAYIITLNPTTKAMLYAIIASAAEDQDITIQPKGTDWDDLDQDNRDIVTMYSQAGRKLGLIG